MRKLLILLVILLSLVVATTASAERKVTTNVICAYCDNSPSCSAANYQQQYFDGNRWWICWTNGLGSYFWLPF